MSSSDSSLEHAPVTEALNAQIAHFTNRHGQQGKFAETLLNFLAMQDVLVQSGHSKDSLVARRSKSPSTSRETLEEYGWSLVTYNNKLKLVRRAGKIASAAWPGGVSTEGKP